MTVKEKARGDEGANIHSQFIISVSLSSWTYGGCVCVLVNHTPQPISRKYPAEQGAGTWRNHGRVYKEHINISKFEVFVNFLTVLPLPFDNFTLFSKNLFPH